MARADLAEIVGSLAGIGGAAMMAVQQPMAGGFALFLVSNVALLTFARRCGFRYLAAQQLAFMATSLVGLWNWWLAPLLGV